MDQHTLHEWEGRCIQEEPPECQAACPLHVDVRAFCGHAAKGNWTAAWEVLARTMPLPAILGRICDGPCQSRCKRGQAGDPLQLPDLERICAGTAAKPQRALPLPKKPLKVAVIGGGLAGLTAAWDLGRKGYGVEIFEPGTWLGQALILAHGPALDKETICSATAVFQTLNIPAHCNAPVAEAAFLAEVIDGFDAVFAGLDVVDGSSWNLPRTADRGLVLAPKLLATGHPKVFAGGSDLPDGVRSPVWQAAQGRWAATSIDRFLQNVSLTAGRDTEGPHPTRLFTSLSGVKPLPAIVPADTGAGYSLEEAAREAGRCLQCQCLECVKVCAYLEHFKAYPKKYAREIYNNESIVMGERKANRLVNSCSLCGLCETVCPEGFAMQDLCLDARRSMVARDKMPPSAHAFALLDLAYSQSKRFALARHQPGHQVSTHVFFPGCQLCASCPPIVQRVYNHLQNHFCGGVGLILNCCGAPALWAGQTTLFEQALEQVHRQWQSLGQPALVVACTTCLKIFEDHLADVPVHSLWQVLAHDRGDRLQPLVPNGPLAVHDPCTSRRMPAVHAAVRALLKQAGIGYEELDLGRAATECCGFGGLMQNANPALAKQVARDRAGRSDSDYIAYCAMCRDNLAAGGKRAVHLLDLLLADPADPDPGARPAPGWSERQENRGRLKDMLLSELWQESPMPMDDHRRINLVIAPEVARLLDERRILVEDVQRVIAHAENSGKKLLHPDTGHFKAAFAPYKATFWVEYGPAADGFVVYNAYSHRMEVIGP